VTLFGEILERIIGKILSIIGSSLLAGAEQMVSKEGVEVILMSMQVMTRVFLMIMRTQG